VNKIGLDKEFPEYEKTLQDSNPELLKALRLCSDDTGCIYPVNHDETNGVKSNAHVVPVEEGAEDKVIQFKAGEYRSM
jgi:hypothetical protein